MACSACCCSAPRASGLSFSCSQREDPNEPVDVVTITSITDSVFGDLDGAGTCSVPQVIAACGSYTCEITEDFEAYTDGDPISGLGGDCCRITFISGSPASGVTSRTRAATRRMPPWAGAAHAA